MCSFLLLLLGVFFIGGSFWFAHDFSQVLSGSLLGLGAFFLAGVTMQASRNAREYAAGSSSEPISIGPMTSAPEAKYAKNGALIGYKVLVYRGHNSPTYESYQSPVQKQVWKNDSIASWWTPDVNNSEGIYFTYDPNDPELKQYKITDDHVIAQLELWGKVIHHERGGRAQYARITRTL